MTAMDKMPGHVPARRILLAASPAKIAEAHSIVEACEGIGVIRTLEPDISVLEIIATPDTFGDAIKLARLLEKLIGAEIISPAGMIRN